MAKMTKQQEIDNLRHRLKMAEASIEQKDQEINRLEDQLAEKRWPTIEAIEEFESEQGKAVAKLLGRLKAE